MWQQDIFSEDVRALYDYVTPELDRIDETILLQRNPDKYQLWTSRQDGKLVSMALVMPLHNTHTLHIDIFAIHPDFRRQGHSFRLLESLFNEVGKVWKCSRMSIEAYHHNVNYFQKFGFRPTVEYSPLWISGNDVKWLVFCPDDPPTPEVVTSMIKEWQNYQSTWGSIGYMY